VVDERHDDLIQSRDRQRADRLVNPRGRGGLSGWRHSKQPNALSPRVIFRPETLLRPGPTHLAYLIGTAPIGSFAKFGASPKIFVTLAAAPDTKGEETM